MKIYQPLKNSRAFQKYGKENTAVIVQHWYKELGLLGHNGWDWNAKDGDKIYYDVDIEGEVINICTDLNAGYGIEILTESEEGIFKHRYWHLRTDGILVRVGQRVRTGDVIGLADNTGKYTTGTHLHRDLKECTYQTNGVLMTLNKDNGYDGAVDIEPYYFPTFAGNIPQINIIKQLLVLYNRVLELMRAKVE